jgi:SPP1 gp7 family putative phage head morphogenesis protein
MLRTTRQHCARRRNVAGRRKPRTGRPVRPNAGLEQAYQRKLDALIDDMQTSLIYWIKAQWRSNTPLLAQDASPAMALRDAIAKLARRWLKQFDDGAPKLAEYFAGNVFSRSDAQLKRILRDAGFSVKFQMTREMNDAYQAVIGENVGLIKSIAEQHLKNVETITMQSVARGRDLGYLARELENTYGVTKRRAALIARDQNNKATSTMQAARQRSLGITQGIWRHSGAGKHPRPDHVKASGEIFDLAKGCEISGQFIMPGELINCRCSWSPIIPGFED